ncbi:MAG: hypothetical protein AAGC79_15820 [Pseudomonadota bacterium]
MTQAICSHCNTASTVTCSGKFAPHAPTQVKTWGKTPVCPLCGPIVYWTCEHCGARQAFMPGTLTATHLGPITKRNAA